MILTVDLTKEVFDDYKSIDFYDSKTIFFDIPTKLPENLAFKIWGASIPDNFDWHKYIDVSKNELLKKVIEKGRDRKCGITIKGFGEIEFKNVVGGKISISPLDMKVKGDYTFFKDRNGDTLSFNREWNIDKITSNCYEYIFDVTIAFPYGACELILYAEGDVKFTFNTEDCICYHDYLLNPNRRETFWGYIDKEETKTYRFDGFEL